MASTTFAPPETAASGYDTVSRALHWATAFLILGVLIPLGLWAHWLGGKGPFRAYLLDQWHKPIGLLVIVLTLARLAWTARRPRVEHAAGLQSWEVALSRIAHVLLYALMLAMPLSGLLMSEGAGRPTSFFGLWTLPQFVTLNPALKPHDQPAYQLGAALHQFVLMWSFFVLIALHIAGALKHQLIDGTRGYLRRMWGIR